MDSFRRKPARTSTAFLDFLLRSLVSCNTQVSHFIVVVFLARLQTKKRLCIKSDLFRSKANEMETKESSDRVSQKILGNLKLRVLTFQYFCSVRLPSRRLSSYCLFVFSFLWFRLFRNNFPSDPFLCYMLYFCSFCLKEYFLYRLAFHCFFAMSIHFRSKLPFLLFRIVFIKFRVLLLL